MSTITYYIWHSVEVSPTAAKGTGAWKWLVKVRGELSPAPSCRLNFKIKADNYQRNMHRYFAEIDGEILIPAGWNAGFLSIQFAYCRITIPTINIHFVSCIAKLMKKLFCLSLPILVSAPPHIRVILIINFLVLSYQVGGLESESISPFTTQWVVGWGTLQIIALILSY